MEQKLQPVIQKFVALLDADNGKIRSYFEKALEKVHQLKVVEYEDIKTVDDFVLYLNHMITSPWLENKYGTAVYQAFMKIQYLFDVDPVDTLQTSETPRPENPKLSALSEWLREYMVALGMWMDDPTWLTPEVERSFYEAAPYNMEEYIRPRGGWKTVNQIFARRFKPGYRPIAAIADNTVITSPADCTFAGQWEVNSNTEVNVKGLYWQISELLEGSKYKDCFKGGQWMHAFLNTYDYHRQHAPVAGTIVESRVVQGAVYVQMELVPLPGDATGRQTLKATTIQKSPDISVNHKIMAPDDAGYEFMQTRGIIIIDSPIGLVAVCPIGMGEVSSIITTAEVGRTLHKGEEISYFQFGGSDICMAFQEKSNISFTAFPGTHYKTGTRIAQAYPVI